MKRGVWIILFCLAAAAQSATYYVSPSGDGDGLGGDEANPKVMGDLSWTSEGDAIYWVSPDVTVAWLKWPDGRTYYTKQVFQFDITWTLSAYTQCGQFVTKEVWLLAAPALTLTAIDPPYFVGDGTSTITTEEKTWTPANGRKINGAMHPYPGRQSFDSAYASAYYSDSYNIAKSVQEGTPYPLDANMVIMSTIGRSIVGSDHSHTYSMAVLTVLEEVPDANSFRPGYGEADPTVRYNASDVDWTAIGGTHTTVANLWTVPQTSATQKLGAATGTGEQYIPPLERIVERPWYLAFGSASDEPFRAVGNQPCYGEYLCQALSLVGMYLQLDYSTDEEMETLAYNYIQKGLDFHSMQERGTVIGPDGGHNAAYKWPVMFAGYALDVPDMNGTTARFQEDSQIFAVDATDANHVPAVPYGYCRISASELFDGVTTAIGGVYYTRYGHAGMRTGNYYELIDYTDHHDKMPEWGIRHDDLSNPLNRWLDGANWEADYRTSNTARSWILEALCATLMRLGDADCGREQWNHEAFFDYLDRYSIHYAWEPLWWTYWDNGGWTISGSSAPRTWPWRVWSELRQSGAVTAVYPVWNGGVDDYDIVAPGVPTGIQATATSSSLTVSWSAPAAAADGDLAAGYRVWLGANRITTPISGNAGNSYVTASTSIEITGLTPSTSYTVWVYSVDDAGIEDIGTSTVAMAGRKATFTTDEEGEEPPTVPDVAQGLWPTDDAPAISISPLLSWTAGTNATSHDVYFGDDESAVAAATTATPTIYIGNQESVTYSPATLGYAATYYWRIDEKNSAGTTKGATLTFTTRSLNESRLILVLR